MKTAERLVRRALATPLLAVLWLDDRLTVRRPQESRAASLQIHYGQTVVTRPADRYDLAGDED